MPCFLLDVPAGNVLVTENYHGKIADFGSMKSLLLATSTGTANQAGSAVSLTSGVGTPLYMAPEVIRGGVYAQAADAWSFGVLLWELMEERSPDLLAELGDTGRGPTLPLLLAQLDAGSRLKIGEDWPQWSRQLVADCFATTPDGRPSFNAMLAIIESAG